MFMVLKYFLWSLFPGSKTFKKQNSSYVVTILLLSLMTMKLYLFIYTIQFYFLTLSTFLII